MNDKDLIEQVIQKLESDLSEDLKCSHQYDQLLGYFNELKDKASNQEKRLKSIIPLKNYTIDEKVKFFDECYDHSLSIYNDTINEEYFDSDNETYSYDQIMKILNIKDPQKPREFMNKFC